MNIVCIRHPHYTGSSSPVLTCKTCCSLYISAVKEKNHGSMSTQEVDKEGNWLQEKKQEIERQRRAQTKSGSPSSPFMF